MDELNKSKTEKGSKFWSMLAGILVIVTLGMGISTTMRAWPLLNLPPMDDILSKVEGTLSEIKNSDGESSRGLVVISVSASSVLPAEGSYIYTPAMANDQDTGTAWVEGNSNAGIDEWLRFDFENKQKISNIAILPGYGSSKDSYYKNNRIKQLRIEFSDNSSESFSLPDEYKTHVISFDAIDTDFVKIIIENVYPGSHYNDAAISEVSFY